LARSVRKIKSNLKDDDKDPAYSNLQTHDELPLKNVKPFPKLSSNAETSVSTVDQKTINAVAKKLSTFSTKAQKKQWFTSIPKHQQQVYCAHLKRKSNTPTTEAPKLSAKASKSQRSNNSTGGGPGTRPPKHSGNGSVVTMIVKSKARQGPPRPPAASTTREKDKDVVIFDADMATDHASVKAKMLTTSKDLRAQLAEQSARAVERVRRIQEITRELTALENPSRKDISEIKGRIEQTERDLVWAEKDLVNKEQAYKEAKTYCEKMRREKRLLIDHMRLILYESDKIKEDKIKDLMAKLAYLQGATLS